MDIIKTTMKSEVTYSEDHVHRLLLKKEWNSKLPKATVITKYPRHQGDVKIDTSTMLIINALYDMGYGTAYLTNLFTNTQMAESIDEIEQLVHEEADDYILKAVKDSEIVILAWGSSSTKIISNRINEIETLLKEDNKKLNKLINPATKKLTHPLNPKSRTFWVLEKIQNTEEEQ